MEPHDFASLGVDAIVVLDDWEYTWSPPVPENHLYVHFPIDDADTVDPKTRQVARLVADLVGAEHRVLVHCVQGLNRSSIVVARALMFLGYSAAEPSTSFGCGGVSTKVSAPWATSGSWSGCCWKKHPGRKTEEARRPRRVVLTACLTPSASPDDARASSR